MYAWLVSVTAKWPGPSEERNWSVSGIYSSIRRIPLQSPGPKPTITDKNGDARLDSLCCWCVPMFSRHSCIPARSYRKPLVIKNIRKFLREGQPAPYREVKTRSISITK